MESELNKEKYMEQSQPALDEIQIRDNYVNKVYISACRSARLAAVLVDAVIFFIPFILFNLFYYGVNNYLEIIRSPGIGHFIITLIACIVIDMSLNGYLLYKYGQTIGKRFMKIKIVDMKDNLPSLIRSYLLRRLLIVVLSCIPLINIISMFDIFFIFTKDRRCLHDYTAGTKVVEVEIP
ncbi:MAG: RDD family protein [Bacteroidota bacterium]|nr:RDD family protein [Bacteroidota bacterium]